MKPERVNPREALISLNQDEVTEIAGALAVNNTELSEEFKALSSNIVQQQKNQQKILERIQNYDYGKVNSAHEIDGTRIDDIIGEEGLARLAADFPEDQISVPRAKKPRLATSGIKGAPLRMPPRPQRVRTSDIVGPEETERAREEAKKARETAKRLTKIPPRHVRSVYQRRTW